MNTTELDALETLLERVLPDPMGYVDRVVEQLLDRLNGAGDRREDQWDRPVVASHAVDANQRLVDQNLVLAAALGACECWGQDPECHECHGRGGPGWLLPNPELYEALVLPASRLAARTARRKAHSDQERADSPNMANHDEPERRSDPSQHEHPDQEQADALHGQGDPS